MLKNLKYLIHSLSAGTMLIADYILNDSIIYHLIQLLFKSEEGTINH